MSQAEAAEFIQTLSDNNYATYDQNLKKLGVADLEDPDYIYIYPTVSTAFAKRIENK